MKIIGTKLEGHDSGVFIINPDNKKIYAINTERLTRRKHDVSSINLILDNLNLKNEEIYFSQCFKKDNYGLFRIRGFRHELLNFLELYSEKEVKNQYSALSNIQKTKKLLRKNFIKGTKYVLKNFYYNLLANIKNEKFNKIMFERYLKKKTQAKNVNIDFLDHHLCHGASAYYFSPFNSREKVLILTIDGYGDGYNSKLFIGYNNKMEFITGSKSDFHSEDWKIREFSIGNLYSYCTEAMDLIPSSDEGKIEALACYAKNPRNKFYRELMNLFFIDDNLSIIPDKTKIKRYADIDFLKLKRKELGDENFCGAIQLFLEEFILEYVRRIVKKYKIKKICLAGGVFANVKLNMRIFEESGIKEIYIFPGMGDGGCFAGSAALKMIQLGKDTSWLKNFVLPYFGDSFEEDEVEKELKKEKYKNIIQFKKDPYLWKTGAKLISLGEVISLFQGKMEFGPRALGNRSVLGNPLKKGTRDIINSTIKRRPFYQPFCPTVLESERKKLFFKSYENKHMTCAFKLKPKEFNKLPSAGHVDGTARPQFISEKDNPNFYKLILEFKKLTGYGIVMNTSFNLHGRTIVMTPEDAIKDFIDCGLNYMIIPPYIIKRKR